MISTQIVYVIGASDNPVKIGIASSLPERLGSLQIGNPDPLICHHFARVSSMRALAVEQAAHRVFADRHRRGEWFDVDWREAAAAVDRLAKAEDTGEDRFNLLTVLRAEYGMKASGRSAVWDYLDRQDRADPYVPHANGFILKRVGTAAYAAFSLVIAQQKALSGLNARETEAAKMALAEAINALCDFRTRRAKAKQSAALTREARQMLADETSLRPRSLPPVRAA